MNEITKHDSAYNLIWIAPRFTQESGGNAEEFRDPIPSKTIENIMGIAARNSASDVRLWVDSKRLTAAQMRWLEKVATECPSGNMSINDLRAVPQYNAQSLFNQPDSSPDWRIDKHSLIWRQVDAARILACLQGDFSQSFYSDADVTNLNVNSPEIQDRLKKHGVILGGGVSNGYAWYENQMFGFDRRQRDFFERLYAQTVVDVTEKRENGYGTYIDLINRDLVGKAGIDTKEAVFQSTHDGTVALHAGNESHVFQGLRPPRPNPSRYDVLSEPVLLPLAPDFQLPGSRDIFKPKTGG